MCFNVQTLNSSSSSRSSMPSKFHTGRVELSARMSKLVKAEAESEVPVGIRKSAPGQSRSSNQSINDLSIPFQPSLFPPSFQAGINLRSGELSVTQYHYQDLRNPTKRRYNRSIISRPATPYERGSQRRFLYRFQILKEDKRYHEKHKVTGY